MRRRIRNVSAVLALVTGLSLWALPEPWGAWGIAAFLLLGAVAVVLSAAPVSRRPAADEHLPREGRARRPGFSDEAWEEAERQPPYPPAT